MSQFDVALDIYHVVILILGVPWLLSAAKGVYSHVSNVLMVMVSFPLLAFHILVVPSFLVDDQLAWVRLAAHSCTAAPMGIALFLVLQRAWDSLKRPLDRGLFVGAGCLGAAALGIWPPGAENLAVIASLTILSVGGGLGCDWEMG